MIIINDRNLGLLMRGETIGILDGSSGKIIQIQLDNFIVKKKKCETAEKLNNLKPLLTRAGIIDI